MDHARSTRLKSALETLAVIGPIICLVDCVIAPAVLAVLPFVGITNVCHGLGDQILALLVLAICSPIIIVGFLKHRRKSVVAKMLLGFAMIFLANFVGNTVDAVMHSLITVTGSIFLLKANFDNKRLSQCSCEGHGHSFKPLTIEVTLLNS